MSGMSTPTQEDLHGWARSYGEDMPERPWLLTPWDVWMANPHYTGPAVRHPMEEEPEEPTRRPLSHEKLPPGCDAAGALPHVRGCINRALLAGFSLVSVDDGEETIPVSTMDEALDAIFSVDMAHCYFERAGERFWVLFITCNHDDPAADWNCRDTEAGRAFDKAMGYEEL